MGQEGAWTADVTFDDVRVDRRRAGRRRRSAPATAPRMTVARPRPDPHRALAVGTGPTRARRVGRLRGASHARAARRSASFQLVQAMLADQQTGVAGGPRDGPRSGAAPTSSGEDRRIAPSAAKLFCTEMAGKVADLAVQIHGGSGLHARDPRRAHLPRRPAAAPLRGHQRDPAADRRRRTAPASPRTWPQDLPLAGITVCRSSRPSPRRWHPPPRRPRRPRDQGRAARGRATSPAHYDHAVRGLATHFVWLNRGKESVELDLKSDAAGAACSPACSRRADVFVHNPAPGVARAPRPRRRRPARRAAPAADRRQHLRLRHGGPPDRKAYDMLVQAESGMLSVTGTPGAPATRPAYPPPTSPRACTPRCPRSARCTAASAPGRAP